MSRHPPAFPACRHRRRRADGGFSLIELMVAMLLGLIVIGGATSVFLASQRTYRTNEALGDVQDNTRIAFELLARDIRKAGMTGCNNDGRVANVLNNQSTDWWATWQDAVRGFDSGANDPAVVIGTGVAERTADTDSLEILGAGDEGLTVAHHDAHSAQFKLNEDSSDLQDGDVVVVCDPDHAVLVQITSYNASNVTFVHNSGAGVATPGNCSKGLGYPTDCSNANGTSYEFGHNSQVAKLDAADWYIGNNADGGRSLYRKQLVTGVGGSGPTITPVAQEVVRNVTGMAFEYHLLGAAAFVDATQVAAAGGWNKVDAVRVKLTVQSTDQHAGSDLKPLQRSFTATTTLRNRVN